MRLGDRTGGATVGELEGASRERFAATASELAWLLAVPCLGVAVLAIVLLASPLGRLLPDGSVTPWPSMAGEFRPEPTEHAAYALALLAPGLLAAAILLTGRWRPRLPRATVWLVAGVQAVGLAFALVCVLGQHRARVEPAYMRIVGTSARTVYFTATTLLVGCAIGLALAGISSSRGASRRLAAALRDTPSRRILAWTLAGLAVTLSLLPAIQLEGTLLRGNVNTFFHLVFTFDETSAVLDGRSPLADFAAQYGSLWPYAIAAAMSVVGTSIGPFTALTALLTGTALLALFAVLRRLVSSATAALLLFLPLLATSLYKMNGSFENRFSLATVTGMWPLRLAGPFLLLWLLARHLDGARPHARWPLFLGGGLVVLNNVEFGVPAYAATLAALVAAGPTSRRALGRLALELAAGSAAALALVSALTLVRAGSLPDLGLLVRYSELFAGSGFGMFAIVPVVGVSTIVLLTYVVAIGSATARAVERDADRLLTGLLAWSGVFGLGVGAYYVGRSHPEVLINMFPAWGLSVVLLTVAVVRSASRRGRLPGPAGIGCLVAFGVLVCSLAQTPLPWAQAERLGRTTQTRLIPPAAVRFVEQHTQPGEPVAILTAGGHRLADLAGVVNVTPYTGMESMPAREQLDETLRILRRAGGRRVIAAVEETVPEAVPAVEQAGFELTAVGAQVGLAVLVRR